VRLPENPHLTHFHFCAPWPKFCASNTLWRRLTVTLPVASSSWFTTLLILNCLSLSLPVKTYLFYKFYPRSFTSSSRTASWPFLLNYSVSVFSERELTFMFATVYDIAVPSVRLSSITFVHPTQPVEIFNFLRRLVRWPSVDNLTSKENFTEFVLGEPLRRGGGG